MEGAIPSISLDLTVNISTAISLADNDSVPPITLSTRKTKNGGDMEKKKVQLQELYSHAKHPSPPNPPER